MEILLQCPTLNRTLEYYSLNTKSKYILKSPSMHDHNYMTNMDINEDDWEYNSPVVGFLARYNTNKLKDGNYIKINENYLNNDLKISSNELANGFNLPNIVVGKTTSNQYNKHTSIVIMYDSKY